MMACKSNASQFSQKCVCVTWVPVACPCGEVDSCPAESSAWLVTAVAAPEAAHSAVGLVWEAVEELAVVAGVGLGVEEAPE